MRDWLTARIEGAGWAVRGWRDGWLRLTEFASARLLQTLALRRNRRRHFRHELAVCGIFKNEARFIEEWLTLHHAVGVEHFYLYNNQSTDKFREVLGPWLQRGLVTLFDWPDSGGLGIDGQVGAYNDCIKRFRMRARWIAFIDLDEFLFSPETRNLRGVLRRYDGAAAIFVHWSLFGSNGHRTRPEGSVIENYTRCMDLQQARADSTRNWRESPLGIVQITGDIINGKSIVNPRLVARAGVHRPARIFSSRILDESGRELQKEVKKDFSYSILKINHYWSKSHEDFLAKIKRQAVWSARDSWKSSAGASAPSPVRGDPSVDVWLEHEKKLNASVDTTLVELWREVIAGKT
jgi:hypothetical protein